MPQIPSIRSMPRLLRKKRFYLLITMVFALGFLYNFLELRHSDATMVEKISRNVFGYRASVQHYDTLGRRIRYVEVGDDSKPLLLFLHGAPSSSSFWLKFMRDSSLLSQFKMLAPDRPGYGYSGFGKAETSVQKQAAIISYILNKKRHIHQHIILHGSSYGGTLAARLAMDYPHLVDGLVLQSASTEPGAEKTYAITHPTSQKPLSWLVPASLQMANREKLSHEEQLRAMLPHWKNIVVPTIILHGTKDGLIYPSNATFSRQQLTSAPLAELIWAEGKGHDLAWTRPRLIHDSLMKILEWAKELKEVENPL